MNILLAPMEGVVDPVLRDLLTAVGGIDFCVTEFLRITETLYPDRVFYKYAPELKTGSRTLAGTPVFVQLLGGNPSTVAENAAKAAELGAFGIDLNFGCPAKTVNRHDGGATLLKNPERVFKMTEAVRKAVPKERPVTVKVRLGFSHKDNILDIAHAAEDAGGHWLTVHARTKEEGYRPPAHWEYIQKMKASVRIPVIANGDIWTPDDHSRCQKISDCQDTMLGRGLVARPGLAKEIKQGQTLTPWSHWPRFLDDFLSKSAAHKDEKYGVTRTKQLTKLMSRTYPESGILFQEIKRLTEYRDVMQIIKNLNPKVAKD